MHNLFVGLEIPAGALPRLGELRGGLTGARWREPTQMHFVIWDFGEVSQGQALALDAKLEGFQSESFDLKLEGVGISGGGEIWAGIVRGPYLEKLQILCATEAVRMKLPSTDSRGDRHAGPRLILGKVAEPNFSEVSVWLAKHEGFAAGPVEIASFGLFERTKDEFGPWTEKIGEFPLGLEVGQFLRASRAPDGER